MDNSDPTDAFDLYKLNKYIEALPKLLELERRGSVEAKMCLAYMYQEGLGVGSDYEEALRRYRSLSDSGAPLGAFYAGSLLERLAKLEEAIDYYRISAQYGNISAAYALYRLGKNHAGNISKVETETYFRQALAGKHVYAERDLAHLMLRGRFGVVGTFRAIPLLISGLFKMLKLMANDPKNQRLY
jgi:TPR repeat protein